MNISKQYYHISRLIARVIIGQSDENEKKAVQRWVETSPENRKIYDNIRKATWYGNKKQAHGEFDPEKAWLRIKPQINTYPKVLPVNKQMYRYIAVAAVILVLAGFMLKTTWSGLIPFSGEEQPVIVRNSIVPGQHTAVLTLSTGTELTLSGSDTKTIPNATTNGKELIYTKKPGDENTTAFHTLTVPRGGQYAMTLSDGSRIWLNSESKISYPVTFEEGKPRIVRFIYGEAYFEISPASAHQGAAFTVHHELQEIEVLGTQFDIKAFLDEATVYTTLVEGSVKIASGEDSRVMRPGEQAVLQSADNRIRLNTVDTSREVSWKNGYFTFKDKSLAEIMKVLSRWYDMDVIFQNPSLKKQKFNGTIHKKQSIEEVMDIIKQGFDTYEIHEKTLIIR
ncbi:FecR family protein [Sinomicrobium oceani]|nr:FecR family protein [Sinomicrobium oceani]